MTVKEIVERLMAGERVTLYSPKKGSLGVGKRILTLDPNDPGQFYVHYGDDDTAFKLPFAFKNNLLNVIVKDQEAEPNFWLAWGRSLHYQKRSLTIP